MSRATQAWSAALILLLASCAPKPALHYQLTPEGLTPPTVKAPIKVREIASGRPCEIQDGPLRMQVRGHNAELRVGPKPTAPELELFRTKILAAEDSGCLITGGAGRLLRVAASSLALSSTQLYNLRYGNYRDSANLDLDVNFRLKTVSPLLAAGVKEIKMESEAPTAPGTIEVKSSPGLEGFETAYYDLQPAPNGGLRPTLTSVEQTRNGKTTAAQKPAGFALQPPPQPGLMRLVFMHANIGTIRGIVLLSAPTYAALNEVTHRLETADDVPSQCRAEAQAFCLPVPKLSIVASQLRVTANGKPVYVPLGGTVGSVLREAGEIQKPPNLQVLRPWHEKLIPVVPSNTNAKLSSLVLIGGEQITW